MHCILHPQACTGAGMFPCKNYDGDRKYCPHMDSSEDLACRDVFDIPLSGCCSSPSKA